MTAWPNELTDFMPRLIRVLFAIGSMQAGGSERQILTLLQHVDRSRYAPELYLIANDGPLQDQIPSDVVQHCYQTRVHHSRNWIPGRIFRSQARDLAKLFEERQIDLVYDRTYHMTLITARATRFRPTPRISTIVGDPRQQFRNPVERFARLKRHLLRDAYRTADVTAVVSDGLRQTAGDYYRLPISTFTTLSNLFDTDEILRKSQEPIAVDRPPSSGTVRIAAVGRLSPEKGNDLLIEAVRQLRDQHPQCPTTCVDILGDGPARDELQQQIEAAHLQEQVILRGFVANPLPWIRQADLFCLPSRYEGMPNALVEALLCETPVLAADCPSGPREILQNGHLGTLVPPNSAEALATGLANIIGNLSDWQGRSAAARESIEQRFSLSAGLARFDQCVAGLLGNS